MKIKLRDLLQVVDDGQRIVINNGITIYEFEKEEAIEFFDIECLYVEGIRYSPIYNAIFIECGKLC